VSVGPRTGPNKRSQGDKEDYVLRRLLAAWTIAGRIAFPCEIRAARTDKGEPDFLLTLPDGRTAGIEITEAGEEKYQEWLTHTELGEEDVIDDPFDPSEQRTVSELVQAIERKVDAFDRGSYRSPGTCHLVIYDNTASGSYLDYSDLVARLRTQVHERSNAFAGRFATVAVIFGERVVLDVLGQPTVVDVSKAYEADYAGWIGEQVKHLQKGETDQLDLKHIAEELADLGRSERRALASYIRNTLVHLLKYELKYELQPAKRTPSWRLSIMNSRAEIDDVLTESPSLRRELPEHVAQQYVRAVRQAADETGLPSEVFPTACPYSPQQLVDDDFFPGTE